jgi:hypothetical protein
MQLDYIRTAIIGAWVLLITGIGVLIDVKSAIGWMLLVGLALGPPIIFSWLWRQPAKTMSQSIHDVLK